MSEQTKSRPSLNTTQTRADLLALLSEAELWFPPTEYHRPISKKQQYKNKARRQKREANWR